MPGNDGGDRVHNFFEQGSLSQDQRHTQLGEGSWPVFNNNWEGNDRQGGGNLSSGSKNFGVQQSDIQRGQNNQFFLSPNGLNFTQSNLRPDFVKNPSQLQQLNLNGFMHAPQSVHSRQNESNFLGGETEHGRHNVTSRGLSSVESQQRSGLQQTNSAGFRGSQSPMNFNFHISQQQMSGQQPGMQPLPRQQTVNDAQLFQQQVMLKQMQEIQRQQQFQQFDALQRSMGNQMPNFQNQMSGNNQLAGNGNPLHNGPNYPWGSQVMVSNTNWPQRGMSSAMQGYPNGLMTSPDQGQALRFMGMIPQQASQSLYGVPVSNSRSADAYSLNNVDKLGMSQIPAPSSSSGNQYASLPEQVSVLDESAISRPGSETKNSLDRASSQNFGNVMNLGSFNHMQPRNDSGGAMQDFISASETVPDKSVTEAASSQAAVGLDPTEEKILFGNDECSIWEAFGPSVTETGGSNRSDDPDLFNGLPSVQSGTWSALMQSAVAETSSTDGNVQEEWSGLDSQNSRPQSAHQASVIHDNEKQHPHWVDNSQRAPFGYQGATNNLSSPAANLNADYCNSPGSQQQFSSENKGNMQTPNQIPQQGRKWLDHNMQMHQSEENWVPERAASSRECSKIDPGFQSNQQSTFFQNNSGQSTNRPNPLNFMESPPANGNVVSTQSVDGTGSRSLNNMKANMSNQKLPDNQQLHLWRSVDSSVNRGIESPGSDQHNFSKGPPILESSVSNDGGAADMCESENGDERETSHDNHSTSFPHQVPSLRFGENVWSDAGDRCGLPGGGEKQSSQAGKVPVTRKFQYHPMGDVEIDADSSHTAKPVLYPQNTSQHLSSDIRGHESQSRFRGPSSTHSTVAEGHLSNHDGATHPSHTPDQHVSSSQNMLELLHKVDQSKEQKPVSTFSSSDFSRSPDIASGGPIGLNRSQSSSSHGFNLQLAPPSQGIVSSNLNFASQTTPIMVDSSTSGHAPDKRDKGHAWLTSVSAAQCSPLTHQPTQGESGNNSSGTLRNMGADGSLENVKGNNPSSSSSSLYMRNPFQNQHMSFAGGNQHVSFNRHQITGSPDQATPSQSVGNSLNILASKNMNQFGMNATLRQMPVGSPSVTPGLYRKDNLSPLGTSMWASHQQLSGAQVRNASVPPMSQVQSNDALETSSFTQQKAREKVGSQEIGDKDSLVGEVRHHGKAAGSQDEQVNVRPPSDASPSTSAASQKDSEAYNHMSKPDYSVQNNYSLVHQMQAMKSTTDPSHRESKRLKGPDNVQSMQAMPGKASQNLPGGHNNIIGDPPMSQTNISAGDARMMSFSPQIGNKNASLLPQGTLNSRDVLSFSPGDPQKRVEHVGISPQMAPSWFERFGTFKNGQLLPVQNVPRVPMLRTADPNLNRVMPAGNMVGNSSAQMLDAVSDSGQTANNGQTTKSYNQIEQVSSLDALVPHAPAPIIDSVRPKKRKTATSDLLPWNKEIGQAFRRLQNLSSAEVDWAQSSNRLVEKVEEETNAHENLVPTIRSKRRLILTTQLMQQVFRPPSMPVLSVGASSDFEILVYSLARLAVGDACSLISNMDGDSAVHTGNRNCLSGKVETPERIRDQFFSKCVEDFSNRANELDNDLLRLDKRASILDFRLDCQDLERFSVINRFARFHGRGQNDGAETSSSSDATAQRPFPQRYVSALPMPKTVPERVQCLSL